MSHEDTKQDTRMTDRISITSANRPARPTSSGHARRSTASTSTRTVRRDRMSDTAHLSEALQIMNARRLVASGDLARFLQKHQISQADLAKALGVSSATVSRWMQGSRVPHWRFGQRLSLLIQEVETHALAMDSAPEKDPGHPDSAHASAEPNREPREVAGRTPIFASQIRIHHLEQEVDRLERTLAAYRTALGRVQTYMDATSRDGKAVAVNSNTAGSPSESWR